MSAPWEITAGVFHRPKPKGGERAGETMDRHVRADGLGVAACDGNLRHDAMVDRFPGFEVRSAKAEVMHLLAREGRYGIGRPRTFDAVKGTTADDHPLLGAWVWPQASVTRDVRGRPPLYVMVGNLVGAMPTNRAPLGGEILRAMVHHAPVRCLLLGVEGDDARLREILGPDWWLCHHDGKDADGVFAAGRHATTKPLDADWLPGAPASSVNAERPILRVRVQVKVMGHRYGPPQPPDPWPTVTVGHPAGLGEHAEREANVHPAIVAQRRAINALAYLAAD